MSEEECEHHHQNCWHMPKVKSIDKSNPFEVAQECDDLQKLNSVIQQCIARNKSLLLEGKRRNAPDFTASFRNFLLVAH